MPRTATDKQTTDSLLPVAAKLNTNSDEDALQAALDQVNAKLTLEQRKRLLREAVAQK